MPDNPTSIRLPSTLRRKLQAAAKHERRPLSVQIVHILTKWTEWWEAQKK